LLHNGFPSEYTAVDTSPSPKEEAAFGRLMAMQLATLAIGFLACLVPLLPQTGAFWGCSRSWEKWYGLVGNNSTLSLTDVQIGSPAAAAGLLTDDVVKAIDGAPVKDVVQWDEWRTHLTPGQKSDVTVRRGEEEKHLTVTGWKPQAEAVEYPIWQLIFAGACAAWMILIAVTQPIPAQARLWRAALLLLSAFGGATAVLFTVSSSGLVWLWRPWLIDNRPFPQFQFFGSLFVCGLLAVSATLESRLIVKQALQKRGSALR